MPMTRILVIGDANTRPISLMDQLKYWGAEYRFASSRADASGLLGFQQFDLVFSRLRLPDATALDLVSLVGGKRIDLFSYIPAEDGFWWLPLVRSGRECVGERAMQPSEFLRLAEKLLKGKASTAVSYAATGSR